MKYLGIFDLIVFSSMLLVSALIGIYFAYFAKKKQNTTSEYLMGGKSMGVYPISMSLIASYISGISILGLPAEMYVYGTQYSMIIFSELLVSVTLIYFYLPVFFKLQITTSYEYLGRRFSTSVKLLGSCIFLLKMMLYIPIVVYVPALAFSQVTGINLHLVSPAVCLICIMYTSMGGLKAVVWTDTFQLMIMMIGMIIVLILGLMKVGFSAVYERSKSSHRLEFFNIEFDPTTRHTLWSVVMGNYFHWLATLSASQAMVQRWLSLSSLKKANLTVGILAIGIVVIISLCCFTGLVIYATYHDCDPISTGKIKKADQLLPLYVMEIASSIPGMPGIFLSGVFSAALSTMSTGLNSMTGVIFEDIIRPTWKRPISEAKASFIMKIIVVIIGIICVAMVFVVEQLGTLIQAGKSLSGITAGPLLGVFSLGLFVPWANHKGALIGGITSLLAVGWISLNAQREIALGNIMFPTKPVTIEGCYPNMINNNTLTETSTSFAREQPFLLYRLSYLWYCMIGTLIAMFVGIIISYATGFNDPHRMDANLFTPFVSRWLNSKRKNEKLKFAEMKTIVN